MVRRRTSRVKAAKKVFRSIRKRDGRIVFFRKERITNAIYKASVAVGQPDWKLAEELAEEAVKRLRRKISFAKVPTVEQVQDEVERILIEKGQAKIAKAYILYRQHRAEIRREKQRVLNKEEIDEVDKKFDLNALRVLASRYLRKNERREVIESPKELFSRVALHSVLPSIFYDPKVCQRKGGAKEHRFEEFDSLKNEGKFGIGKFKFNQFHLEALKRLYDFFNSKQKMKVSWSRLLAFLKEKKFDGYEAEIQSYYDIMVNRHFLPNTPALANFGSYLGMGSACFVLDVEDAIDGPNSIMETLKNAAVIFKAGGGVGYNFSKLRPEGDFVKSTGGVASGPLSFMSMFDNMTEVVKQGGIRRGANMGILNSNHPDVEKFISAKEGNKALRNFNISVLIMSDFWDSYRKNEPYPLVNPRNGEIVRYVNPKQLFDKIVYQAWESAEPGVIFFDKVNEYNPFFKELGPIVSTNPCVSGDSLVSTDQGLKPISSLNSERILVDGRAISQAEKDLVKVEIDGEERKIRILGRYEKERTLNNRGVDLSEISSVFQTGFKEIFKIEAKSGYEIKATADHMFLTPAGWRELQSLQAGDEIFIQSGKGKWNRDKNLPFAVQNLIIGRNGRSYKFNLPLKWSRELGWVLGWLTGDGWLCEKHHSLGWVFAQESREVQEKLQLILEDYFQRKINLAGGLRGVWHLRSSSAAVADFFQRLGVKDSKEDREVPQLIFTASEEAVKGFIEGLFSADGTIGEGSESRNYVRLNSSSLKLLKQVQLILLNFGIRSSIYDRSTEPKFFEYKTAKGENKRYFTNGVNYELNVSKENLAKFADSFDFLQSNKNKKLASLKNKYGFYREYFIEKIKKINPLGKMQVWDLTEKKSHSFIGNGFVLKNCGELLLYPFESCNLGSINVWSFVKDNHNGKVNVDWEKMSEAVRVAARFLDNVVDVNKYPMKEIQEMTMSTRKIGLGVMGVGDLLYELGIPYNSRQGLAFLEQLMEFINYHSKIVSIELAKERGRMPFFDKSFYKEGKLPFSGFKDKSSWHFDWDKVSKDIQNYGIRNSYTTAVAPTGSISMIAGCSSGMEPVYSLVFEKNVSVGSFYYVDPVFESRMQKEGLMDADLLRDVVALSGSVQNLSYIPAKLKKNFVTALDIAPRDHIRSLAAVQKWTDSSVSKTNNFPADATVDYMKDSYLLAYELGCKDVTVYRDTSIKNQVLVSGDKKKREEKQKKDGEAEKLIPMKDEKAKGLAVYQAKASGNGETLNMSPAVDLAAANLNGNGKCPSCGTELVKKEGCKTCPSCGWGLCV